MRPTNTLSAVEPVAYPWKLTAARPAEDDDQRLEHFAEVERTVFRNAGHDDVEDGSRLTDPPDEIGPLNLADADEPDAD